MKKLFILIPVVSLFVISCNNQNEESKEGEIKEVVESLPGSDSLNQGVCSFNNVLENPQTPVLAKDIYLDKPWDMGKEDEVLDFIDSLMKGSKATKPFYFKVLLKSGKKGDGAYSEALGLAAKEYAEKNTKEFASYFDDRNCFTMDDLSAYADLVKTEFMIIGEGEYDKPIVDDYVKRLEQNCVSCSKDQKTTIMRFGGMLKMKWKDFLKNTESK